ncbi:hypothetical protein BaRGS_00030542 [Batillaria attramentaria]|uniref:Uncharacterized protein n=1 Tax=Batillaria attramentaria TaxID=370345 RepID=A0ABD0JTS6_9CAEN
MGDTKGFSFLVVGHSGTVKVIKSDSQYVMFDPSRRWKEERLRQVVAGLGRDKAVLRVVVALLRRKETVLRGVVLELLVKEADLEGMVAELEKADKGEKAVVRLVAKLGRVVAELREAEAELREPEAELREVEAELRREEAELRREEAELREAEAETRGVEAELPWEFSFYERKYFWASKLIPRPSRSARMQFDAAMMQFGPIDFYLLPILSVKCRYTIVRRESSVKSYSTTLPKESSVKSYSTTLPKESRCLINKAISRRNKARSLRPKSRSRTVTSDNLSAMALEETKQLGERRGVLHDKRYSGRTTHLQQYSQRPAQRRGAATAILTSQPRGSVLSSSMMSCSKCQTPSLGSSDTVWASHRGPITSQKDWLDFVVRELSRHAVSEAHKASVWQHEPPWWKGECRLRWKNPTTNPKDSKDTLETKFECLEKHLRKEGSLPCVLEDEITLWQSNRKSEALLSRSYKILVSNCVDLQDSLTKVLDLKQKIPITNTNIPDLHSTSLDIMEQCVAKWREGEAGHQVLAANLGGQNSNTTNPQSHKLSPATTSKPTCTATVTTATLSSSVARETSALLQDVSGGRISENQKPNPSIAGTKRKHEDEITSRVREVDISSQAGDEEEGATTRDNDGRAKQKGVKSMKADTATCTSALTEAASVSFPANHSFAAAILGTRKPDDTDDEDSVDSVCLDSCLSQLNEDQIPTPVYHKVYFGNSEQMPSDQTLIDAMQDIEMATVSSKDPANVSQAALQLTVNLLENVSTSSETSTSTSSATVVRPDSSSTAISRDTLVTHTAGSCEAETERLGEGESAHDIDPNKASLETFLESSSHP